MKTNSTKSKLISSLLILTLCVTMFVGSTYAWFTDSVTSTGNQIVSGTLDVDLVNANGDSLAGGNIKWAAKDGRSDILWEPGCTYQTEQIFVENKGSLALKYDIAINGITGSAELLNVIEWSVLMDNQEIDLDTFVGKLNKGEKSKAIVIQGHMKETAGNEYQNKTLDAFSITVEAYQLNSEADSFGPDYDIIVPNVEWYVEAGADATEYVIDTADELAGLAAIVNGTAVKPSQASTVAAGTASTTVTATEPIPADTFEGQTIKLGADIDLMNKNWVPIGNWDNAFEGDFDGADKIISNLMIYAPSAEGVGLFGVAQKADIKGINVKNANINGYSMVGTIVGSPYTGCTISDCHVSGNIKIVAEYAYAGGISAYGYVDIDGCSVIADGTGVITAKERNAVGGITAWMLEGDNRITDCQVKNLDLTGWANIGAITGFIHYSNVIDGCTAENINITKTRVDGLPSVGIAAGGFSYNAAKACTITNNTFNYITLNGTAVAISSANYLWGSEYGGALNNHFVTSNNVESGIVNNLVYLDEVNTVAALADAVANGGKYVVKNDIIVSETTFTVPADKEAVLYLNGKTISGTFENTSNANKVLFDVKGNLTVNGAGTIKMNTTGINMGWNAMGCTICVNGGDLTVNGATIINEGGTDMSFALDTNPWNPASNEVLDVILNDAKIESTQYRGIRIRDNGPYLAKLVANNSVIDEIWYQEYASGDNISKGNYGVLVKVILNNTPADTSKVNSSVLTIN